MGNTNHCLGHKPLEVSRTLLHQRSGGTGSAPASYLPQLAGGCVALGTSTLSGAGGGASQARPLATSGPLPIFLCECV